MERAASDRLSRVRRDEGLQRVLGPILGLGVVNPLSDEDISWETMPVEVEDEADLIDDDADRDATMQLIIDSDDARLPS